MGEQALRPHMKSKKHLKSIERINVIFQSCRQPMITTITEQSTTEPSVSTPPFYQKQLTLVSNLSSAEKREAELLWTLKCFRSDMSALSYEGVSELFEVMFSDSQIAKDFQMSQTKMTYIINFAIEPYFLEILISELKSCNYYSVSLHECINDIIQTCQMDVHVRYWNSSKDQICVRQLDSKFMGHATANGLLENFSDVINNVDGGNCMIQVSMDGPSTSWKFFNLLQNDRVEKEQHNLIDIGSCSLHIIHGAFKTGAESCCSNMKVILKGAFTILDHTPARREDYITHSHGQADVKRGFILNKNFLNQNMETLTITSCGKVKDHLISNKIVLHEFKVPSTLLQYTQSARQKYEVYLETSRSEKEQDRKSKQINVTDQEIKKTEALR